VGLKRPDAGTTEAGACSIVRAESVTPCNGPVTGRQALRPADVIDTWIWYKRQQEADAIWPRPHPYGRPPNQARAKPRRKAGRRPEASARRAQSPRSDELFALSAPSRATGLGPQPQENRHEND
jgi:hypothetical protein